MWKNRKKWGKNVKDSENYEKQEKLKEPQTTGVECDFWPTKFS